LGDAEGGATELGWTTRLVGEGHELRRDSPFAAGLPLTGFGRDRYRIEQELRGRAGPVSLLLTATESGQEGAKPNGRFLANEAYVDFSLGGQRFSAARRCWPATSATPSARSTCCSGKAGCR
jgi:hypothetical protein